MTSKQKTLIVALALLFVLIVATIIFRHAGQGPRTTSGDSSPHEANLPQAKDYSNKHLGFSFSYPTGFTLGNLKETPNSFYAELCQDSCFMSAGDFMIVEDETALSNFKYDAGWRMVGIEEKPPAVISTQEISIGPSKLSGIERVVEYNYSSAEYRTWIQFSANHHLFSFSFDPDQEPGRTIMQTFDIKADSQQMSAQAD